MIYHSFFKPDEYFIPIIGYNDEYEISNYACLYDKKRNSLKLDNPASKETSYRTITLRSENGARSLQFHQLMGECFLDNPDKTKIVNHKDRNRRNNALYNLEWATYSENSSHHHHYEIARCRLINIGDSVFVKNIGEYRTVKRKIGNRGLELSDYKYSYETIENVIGPIENQIEYPKLLQRMIDKVSRDFSEQKRVRDERRVSRLSRELKDIMEGKK